MFGFEKTWGFGFGFWETTGGLFEKGFGLPGLLADGLTWSSGLLKLLFILAGVLNCLNCFCLVGALTWNAALFLCEVGTAVTFCSTGFGFEWRETGGGSLKSSG